MQEPILMSWSGGKDSCMALREIQNSGSYRVAALLTTVSVDYDRICMHGVRRTLLDRQVESLGLPVHAIHLSNDPSNDEYEAKMRETLIAYRERGVKAIAFGDLFLEDIRQYRELRLAEVEMTGVFFPLCSAFRGRSVRRERRVSQLRFRRTDLQRRSEFENRRDRFARWLLFL